MPCAIPTKRHAGAVAAGDAGCGTGGAGKCGVRSPKSEVFGTDGGTLVLFAADSKEYREASRVQVCGANWCNPAYAEGRLYLRDGLRQSGEWMCLTLAE